MVWFALPNDIEQNSLESQSYFTSKFSLIRGFILGKSSYPWRLNGEKVSGEIQSNLKRSCRANTLHCSYPKLLKEKSMKWDPQLARSLCGECIKCPATVFVYSLIWILAENLSFPRCVYFSNKWTCTRPLLTRSRSCFRTFDHFIAHVWV